MHGRKFEFVLLLLLSFSSPAIKFACCQSPLMQARHELDRGRWQAAVALLKTYQRQHPSDPSTYDLLGIAYARAGQTQHSLQMFKRFADLAPQKPEAFNNLGGIYLQLGDAVEAEKAFRHCLALDSNNVDALYNLGALLNAEHHYHSALPYLRRAYTLQQSAGIVYELAVADAQTGSRASARELLSSMAPPSGTKAMPWLQMLGALNLSAGNYVSAAKNLEIVLRLVPNDRSALYTMALVQLKLGHPAEAMALLDKSFASLPAPKRYIRAGNVLAVYGAFDEAIQEFERGAKDDPRSYDAYYNLAVVRLEKAKDLPGAFHAAMQASAIRPSAEIQALLGSICDAQHRYRQALDRYQRAVRLAPADDRYVFDLGTELILHGDYNEARMVFRLAQKRFPQSALIELGLGTAEFIGGKRSDAAIDFVHAVDLNSSYAPAYMLLGEVASSAGPAMPEVIQKLAYAARREPDQFQIQYYYGAALVTQMDRTGDLEKESTALVALRRAASLKPDDPRIYYELGEIARLCHRNSEALRFYQKAVSLNPEFTVALYKLAAQYAREGRVKDAQTLFAREQKVSMEERKNLYQRSKAVERFILQIRNGNSP